MARIIAGWLIMQYIIAHEARGAEASYRLVDCKPLANILLYINEP